MNTQSRKMPITVTVRSYIGKNARCLIRSTLAIGLKQFKIYEIDQRKIPLRCHSLLTLTDEVSVSIMVYYALGGESGLWMASMNPHGHHTKTALLLSTLPRTPSLMPGPSRHLTQGCPPNSVPSLLHE